jgi:hypothetical protein
MSKYTPSVAIVIPNYRAHLTSAEKLSLKQWQKHLSDYDTYAISPPGLSQIHPDITSIYFEPEYFSSIRGYSQLLLTEKFYQTFAKYDYILIYQLDALVFSNQLTKWCQQKMSYIGAPWLSSFIGSLTSPTSDLRGGNGGLSLRSVSESIKVLAAVNTSARHNFPARWQQWAWFALELLFGKTKQKWLKIPADQYPFNEDGFWSFEAPKYCQSFRVATQSESLQFAFETEPAKCFELNGKKLPFGAHAWEKYDKKFWTQNSSFFS